MEAKTYNGWTNYETWCVALWLDNDQRTYAHYQNQALRCWEFSESGSKLQEVGLSRKEDAICTLSKVIQEEVEESQPEVYGLYADLLGAAMSEVNWNEIATHYIDDLREANDSSQK